MQRRKAPSPRKGSEETCMGCLTVNRRDAQEAKREDAFFLPPGKGAAIWSPRPIHHYYCRLQFVSGAFRINPKRIHPALLPRVHPLEDPTATSTYDLASLEGYMGLFTNNIVEESSGRPVSRSRTEKCINNVQADTFFTLRGCTTTNERNEE